MTILDEVDSLNRYRAPAEPTPVEYVTIALGKEMDTENVSQWFLDDINLLLRSICVSLDRPDYGHFLSSIEFKKSEKGLEVYSRVHPHFVAPESFGFKRL